MGLDTPTDCFFEHFYDIIILLERLLIYMTKKKDKVKDFINKDYIDDNGNAVVDVVINDPANLFSPYSAKMLLKRDIFLYLDTIADPIPNDYPLIINFVVDDLTKVDQNYVREALKRYYWFSYKEMERNLLKELLLSLLYFFIGAILLTVDAFFNAGNNPWFTIISNLVIVISWVFIWEGFTQLFIGRRAKIVDMTNERQMALATVRFISKIGD